MSTRRRKSRPRHSVRRHAAIDPHQSLAPPGYLHVEEYTEQQLHDRLVLDWTTGVPTPLTWCAAAYDRIGRLSGRGAEAAYTAVRVEATAVSRGLGFPLG